MAANPAPQTLKGKVLRPFYYKAGEPPLKVGEVLELPRIFALEMKAANKFELEQAPQAPAVSAQPAPSAPELRSPPKAEPKAAGKKGDK